MRVTHGMLQRNVLADINAASVRLAKVSEQLSSGLQRSRASEDPAAAARSARLTSALAGTQDLQRSVEDATTWADATETALTGMTDIVARARDLLVTAGTGTATQASMNAVADEIDQLAEGLKDQGNVAVGGRYLLGGTATTTPPYGAATGDAYQGDGGTVAREIGVGTSVAINVRAGDVLGSGGGDGKLLAVLRDVATHLRAGDAATVRGADLVAIDGGRDTLLAARALNGALTRRLDASGDQLLAFEEQTTKALGVTDAADYAKLSTEYSTRYAAYQASLKAGASIVQSSLMDFLR